MAGRAILEHNEIILYKRHEHYRLNQKDPCTLLTVGRLNVRNYCQSLRFIPWAVDISEQGPGVEIAIERGEKFSTANNLC